MVGYHIYHLEFINHILIASNMEKSYDFEMRICEVIILCNKLKVSNEGHFTSRDDGPT